MNNRIENYKDGKYASDITQILTIVGEWDKIKPSDTTKILLRAAIDVSFYVSNLQMDLIALKHFQSEYRNDKLRAIERARKAEERIEQLEKLLKTKLNL